MQKKQGISLIVLVITIIVMIILAAAIILSLNNAGIIGNANKAVQETNVANVKSAADLLYADYMIAGTNKGLTEEELGTKLTNDLKTNGTITGNDYYIKVIEGETAVITVGSAVDKFYKGEIKIGDYIQYDPTDGVTETITYTSPKERNGYGIQEFSLTGSYNNEEFGWQVMGVGKGGELLLLSEDFIQPISGGEEYEERVVFGLSGAVEGDINKSREVYLTAVGELNNICSIFGKGYGSTGARCITAQDVDKITGYKANEMIYEDNKIGEYGNEITFYWKNDNGTIKVWYKCSNEVEGYYENNDSTSNHRVFEWFDGTTYHKETAPTSAQLAEGEKKKITTLKNDYYWYYPETLTRLNTDPKAGKVQPGSLEYDLLFTDAREVNTNCYYWLASPFVYSSATYVRFGVCRVRAGRTGGLDVFRSNGDGHTAGLGVRAVVSLESGIKVNTVSYQEDAESVYSIAK